MNTSAAWTTSPSTLEAVGGVSKPTPGARRVRSRGRAAGAAPRARRVWPRGPAIWRVASAMSVGSPRENASPTTVASSGPGSHGSVRSVVEAESRRRLQRPVARVVLEQERAGSASKVERVLVQMRQQIVWSRDCAPAARSEAAGQCRHRPNPDRRPGASTAWFVVLGTSCSVGFPERLGRDSTAIARFARPSIGRNLCRPQPDRDGAVYYNPSRLRCLARYQL